MFLGFRISLELFKTTFSGAGMPLRTDDPVIDY